MQAFIVRRLLAVIPTLLFTSVIVFASIRLIPGDVVDLMLAQNDISTSTDQHVEAALGLDKPIYEQYFVWIFNIGKEISATPLAEHSSRRAIITHFAHHIRVRVVSADRSPIGSHSNRHLFGHEARHSW